MKIINIILINITIILILNYPLYADNLNQEWGSLKYNKTYLRTGPSKANKVIWVYKRRGLPIKILREKGDWIQILLPGNQKGWISSSQLSKKKTALVYDSTSEIDKALKNRKPLTVKNASGKPIAYIHNGVIVKLIDCDKIICEIELSIKKEKYFFKNTYHLKGYFEKRYLWGAN